MALFGNNPILAKWVSEGLSAHDKNLESFREDPMNVNLIGSRAHEGLMYVTPEKYEDDVNAFLYYGSIGLMDPKNPGDAKIYSKALNLRYGTALGVALIGGFFFWGAIGWGIDWEDRREGGLAETDWYSKWTNPDNYSLPQGW